MIAGDLGHRTQPVLGKLANIAAKKDYTRGEFLSNGHTDKFHQNRTPLESILSSLSTS
jgi:hypothetical protein